MGSLSICLGGFNTETADVIFFIVNEGININTRTWSTVRAIGIDSNTVELFIVRSLLSVRFSGFNTQLLMFCLFMGNKQSLLAS